MRMVSSCESCVLVVCVHTGVLGISDYMSVCGVLEHGDSRKAGDICRV